MKQLLILFLTLLPTLLPAQESAPTQSTDIKLSDNALCRVTFYSPTIVRIEKYSQDALPRTTRKSLAVSMLPEDVKLNVKRQSTRTQIASPRLNVSVDHKTGSVQFSSKGKTLLKEGPHSITAITEGADQGRYSVSQTYALDPQEAVYGIGLMENGKLNQRGEDRLMIQSNLEDYQNIFQSIKGYGVFWDNYSPTRLKDTAKDGLTLDSEVGDGIDYYFMYGINADGVVRQIRQLTGEAPMLPIHSYGFWQSRERYKSSRELTEVVDQYRQLGIPLDGIVLDWQYWDSNYLWNAMEFLNPEFSQPQRMIDHIHQQHAKFAISIWQSFGPYTKGYADMEKKGLLFNFQTWPQSGLSVWPPNMDYPSGVRVYKPYTEEARDIYWKNLKKLYDMGVDAWWMDSTDPDHHNFKESDLDEPTALGSYRSVRNAFPLMCVKGVYEHQRSANTNPDARRAFIYTRSGFAGQQRYACNVWTGDVTSSWQNLRNQIPMGLNFSLTGNPNFNSDIGGFFSGAYNNHNDPTTGCRNPRYQELYVRWMQFGAFCPMMRSHGTETYREVYYFGKQGEPVYDALVDAIRLRYRLLPYIYSTAWEVSNRQGTFMRALPMDFSHDPQVMDMTDEYLFGRALLVAPIVKAQYTDEKRQGVSGVQEVDFMEPKTTSVYLPKGARWYDLQSGKRYDGNRHVELPTTIKTIPLFVREGSILPIGPDMQYTGEKAWDDLEIRVYPGADGTFTLYEDDGNTYKYEQGQYAEITFQWNDRTRTLTIANRKGAFPGMLKQRHFRIVNVLTGASQTADYTGDLVTIQL